MTNLQDIETSIIITPHVINTIRALPNRERKAISEALVLELLLGIDPKDNLLPFQVMLYAFIKFYVIQDMSRLTVVRSK